MYCAGFDSDSLNLACLDYICSGKLFSGLSQRQLTVENVDNWRGGELPRYRNEVDWVKITIVCTRLGQHKLKGRK